MKSGWDTRKICANDLDAMKIHDWRRRLQSARWASPQAFDAEWSRVKQKYLEAVTMNEGDE